MMSGEGAAKMFPAAAVSAIPTPTYPNIAGSWPDPPPIATPTLAVAASARSTTRVEAIAKTSRWAETMASSISSTTAAGSLISFFTFAVPLVSLVVRSLRRSTWGIASDETTAGSIALSSGSRPSPSRGHRFESDRGVGADEAWTQGPVFEAIDRSQSPKRSLAATLASPLVLATTLHRHHGSARRRHELRASAPRLESSSKPPARSDRPSAGRSCSGLGEPLTTALAVIAKAPLSSRRALASRPLRAPDRPCGWLPLAEARQAPRSCFWRISGPGPRCGPALLPQRRGYRAGRLLGDSGR